ncbi:MAG: sigma-70 family RNA polymerase sigma factor [Planctomycetota bacterium]|nr:sigma-70 family RNA polymerase sigma factor [Planctomycetota bacterium]
MSEQASSGEDELDRRFTGLVREHQAMVGRYARYLVRDAVQAEEIAQDAFVTAYTKLRRDPPAGDLGAWLRGVVRNLVLRSRTKRKVQVVFTDEAGLEVAERVWEAQPSGATDPRLDALRRCVDALDDGEKQLLKLRFEENRSRGKIAEALKLTGEGVKTRLRRLRARLFECTQRRLAGRKNQGGGR